MVVVPVSGLSSALLRRTAEKRTIDSELTNRLFDSLGRQSRIEWPRKVNLGTRVRLTAKVRSSGMAIEPGATFPVRVVEMRINGAPIEWAVCNS